MTKDQLEKSISLIGLACVGKSLISEELSKRLGIPAINFDDLIVVMEYEKKGLLGPSKELQEAYFNFCLEDIANDDLMYENVTPKYLAKEMQLIRDFINTYNNYRNLIGDFRPLYNLIDYHSYLLDNNEDSNELTVLLNNISLELMKYIVKKVNTPIIFDLPAPYGWEMDKDFLDEDAKKKLKNSEANILIKKVNKEIHKLIGNTHSVLLSPGLDYEKRNATRESECNNTILSSLENYYPNADIEITTNGLFNNPEHKAFKHRMYFDAKEMTAKESLRNNGEIDNLCDEIITRINELYRGGI